MRSAVIARIHTLMERDSDIYFLTGDLGYNVLEEMEAEFPKRFANVGVAEQNMIGIAAGLALNGKKVFVYSIIPFVTMRCFEQIRNDIAYHDLDVTLLGVGSGLSYGILANTHFALEDVGILRCLPDMTIVSPADGLEASLAVDAIYNHKGPVYLRIGKREEPKILQEPYPFKIGRGVILQEGKDIALFATGTIFSNVIAAAKILQEKHKISATIVNIHTIKPLDKKLILNTSYGKKAVFTIEEHSVKGGLGSAVAEVLSEVKDHPPLYRIGTPDKIIKHMGSQEYLRKKLRLSPEAIVRKIASIQDK